MAREAVCGAGCCSGLIGTSYYRAEPTLSFLRPEERVWNGLDKHACVAHILYAPHKEARGFHGSGSGPRDRETPAVAAGRVSHPPQPRSRRTARHGIIQDIERRGETSVPDVGTMYR